MLKKEIRRSKISYLILYLSISGIISVSGQNLALVPNFLDSSLSVVDLNDFSLKETLKVESQPESVTWLPDCSRIYIGNSYGQSITLYDFDGKIFSPAGNISTTYSVRGMAVTPDGAELWVADQSNGNVKIYDTETNAELADLDVGTGHPIFGGAVSIEMSPDGKKVIVTNGTDYSVSFIDSESRSVNTLSPPELAGSGIAWGAVSNSGTRYATAGRFSNKIYLFDLSNESFISSTDVGSFPIGLIWNSSDTKIYVVNYSSNDILTVEANTLTDIYSVSSAPIALSAGGKPIGIDIDRHDFYLYVPLSSLDRLAKVSIISHTEVTTIAVGNNPAAIGLFVKDTPIPTLSEWAVLLLGLCLGIMSIAAYRSLFSPAVGKLS